MAGCVKSVILDVPYDRVRSRLDRRFTSDSFYKIVPVGGEFSAYVAFENCHKGTRMKVARWAEPDVMEYLSKKLGRSVTALAD